MEEHVQTFIGRNTAGQNVVLQVWRQIDSNGAGELHAGPIRIALQDGRTLERKDKGRYELLPTRETISCDAPDAP